MRPAAHRREHLEAACRKPSIRDEVELPSRRGMLSVQDLSRVRARRQNARRLRRRASCTRRIELVRSMSAGTRAQGELGRARGRHPGRAKPCSPPSGASTDEYAAGEGGLIARRRRRPDPRRSGRPAITYGGAGCLWCRPARHASRRRASMPDGHRFRVERKSRARSGLPPPYTPTRCEGRFGWCHGLRTISPVLELHWGSPLRGPREVRSALRSHKRRLIAR